MGHHSSLMTLCGTVALALGACGDIAWAQAAPVPVATFNQLDAVLKIGETLFVTDTAGLEHEGRLLELSASALRLVTPGAVKEIDAAQVSAIGRQRPDSKMNGALIGLGVGVAIGVALAAQANSTGNAAANSVLYGGVGALIGVGIDGFTPGKRVTVYRAPPASSASGFSIWPMVSPRRYSLEARVAF